MIILGMQFGHDGGVCLIKDGEILSYIYRERQCRRKHVIGVSDNEMNKLLDDAGVKLSDIDACAISSTQGVEIINGLISGFHISLKKHKDDKAPSPFADMLSESGLRVEDRGFFALRRMFKTPEKDQNRLSYQAFSYMCLEKDKIASDEIETTCWIDDYIQTNDWANGLKLNEIANSSAKKLLENKDIIYGFHYPVTVTLGGREIPGYFVNHHIAHAAAAYYASNILESAIITHDGYDSGESYYGGIICYGKDNKLYPISTHHLAIGTLYETTAMLVGLGVSSAGKLMGLAPYGKPRFFNPALVGNLYDIKEKFGSNQIDAWQKHCIGTAQKMGYDLSALGDTTRILEPINVDIAASTQKLFEECYLSTVYSAHSALLASGIKTKNLCLSGGTALNCPSNSKIYNEGPFDDVYIQPHCPDDGLAMGSALYVYHHLYDNPLIEKNLGSWSSPYMGPKIKQSEIETAFAKFSDNVKFEKLNDASKQAAQDLLANKVIGWFEGRSEAGPRALGHRSIVANPTHKENWQHVNEIKQRELWRPFAPSVLEEEAENWFRGLPKISPYMLFTGQVLRPDKLPAITHVDNSSRIQTVNESAGDYYNLIKEFFKLSGVPVVLNTSFNGPKDPIIETPEQAVEFLATTNLDVLYICGYRVVKMAEVRAVRKKELLGAE